MIPSPVTQIIPNKNNIKTYIPLITAILKTISKTLLAKITYSLIMLHAIHAQAAEIKGFTSHKSKLNFDFDILSTLYAFKHEVTKLLTYITNKNPFIPYLGRIKHIKPILNEESIILYFNDFFC